jgi:hypothetical protein
MSNLNTGLAPRRVSARLLCGAAASVCAIGGLAALLMLFHQASVDPWLQPSPALLADRARCDTLPDRPERERCARAVIEQALLRERGGGQFARH